jgi:hypothetical protein
MSPLLLDVAAVVLTISGQFAIPLGALLSVPPGAALNASFRTITADVWRTAFRTGCFADFGFVQQLCPPAASQVSPSTTVVLESTGSAPIACILPHPNRQPPAIQTDTLKARRTREVLMNRTDLIAQKSTPKNTKAQRPRKCYVTVGLVA